jgi:hypothetical protein
MAKRVLLHVGAMKSGTSFIQARLLANQDALARQGVLFPGRTWRDQVLAVSDVLEHRREGPVSKEGRWQRLLDEATAWTGTVVVSMEFLGPAKPQNIRKVVESFPNSHVDVVMTVRDLGRSIPAMWQETVQNSKTWTWAEYCAGIRRGPRMGDAAGRHFWRQHNTPQMAARWIDAVGRDNFTLVTLPPPGAGTEVLWERFCSVAGIDPGSCAPVPPTNESMGLASALLMRRLNVLLAEQGMPWKDYTTFVKWGLAKDSLAKRRKDEPALGFTVERWVEKRANKLVKQFRELGVRVVGDLADLRPVDVPGVDPATVSEADQLDAALAGLAGVLRLRGPDREKRVKPGRRDRT